MISTSYYRWSILWSNQKLHLEVGPELNDIMEDHPDLVKPGETNWNKMRQGETKWNSLRGNILALGVAVGPLPAVEVSNQWVHNVASMENEV